MGAALAIPLIVIVVAAVIYALWALFAAGQSGLSSFRRDKRGSNETAAHYEGDDVSHTPPGED
jgi:hypothetical protein